jgi:hypothetical protein
MEFKIRRFYGEKQFFTEIQILFCLEIVRAIFIETFIDSKFTAGFVNM